MKVLVACEFSGVVRDAFRSLGHEAYSCDLLPAETNSQWHYHMSIFDCMPLIGEVDLLIAHPPCTFICNSGVRWLKNSDGSVNSTRWEEMVKSSGLFRYLMRHSAANRIAVENPVPHRYAVHEIGRKYDQIIQPWQFGHGETKATCLWLDNLPKLKPTDIVEGREPRIHKMPPSKDRGKLRSITYSGIAMAMAKQWGEL